MRRGEQASTEAHSELADHAAILPEERDFNLELSSPEWGAGLSRWQLCSSPERHFIREFPVHTGGSETSRLREAIVPFPSAPIFGINRKSEYGVALEKRANMHTVRVLTRPGGHPIRRLFILQNGLNETDSLRFYYRLADWIIRQQELASSSEGAACLIVPFPGHLMHSPFHDLFSETPLARYLNDSGDLFRQFLKYMVAMRWLLSSVVDCDAEPWMVGGQLLPTNDCVGELFRDSRHLYMQSKTRMELQRAAIIERSDGPPPPEIDIGLPTSRGDVERSVRALRGVLGRRGRGRSSSLKTHIVGYSLGGFVAQSVFFCWPQVVSSCTTICSGGAISALSPTAFAQPEEWQSVLHSLRPELSNSMLQGRLGDHHRDWFESVENVAGLPLQHFGYLQRIFEQVFLQEDGGSYKERLSEYGLRMLFISGGEDPIAPPANILDASPREGTTMLSVAGMTHFLNQDPKEERGRREKEQRDFWLPEAGGLIARAAIHSEQVHRDEREAASLSRNWTPPKKKRRAATGAGPPPAATLLSDSALFESALDWVLDAVDDEGGWLFLCRNTLPAAFIEPRHLTRWGAALHHHDVRVQEYVKGLRRHAQALRRIDDRATLVIPEQLRHWFVDLSARFDTHSDGPSGRMTLQADREEIWRAFERKWKGSIREFRAGNIAKPRSKEPLEAEAFAHAVAAWQGIRLEYLEATHIPDIWISVSEASSLVNTQGRRPKKVLQNLVDAAEGLASDGARQLHAERRGDQRPASPYTGKLEKDVQRGHIRVVQISGAEFNPRFRGKVVTRSSAVATLLVRTAAGLVRSSSPDAQAPASSEPPRLSANPP